MKIPTRVRRVLPSRMHSGDSISHKTYLMIKMPLSLPMHVLNEFDSPMLPSVSIWMIPGMNGIVLRMVPRYPCHSTRGIGIKIFISIMMKVPSRLIDRDYRNDVFKPYYNNLSNLD